MEPDLHSFLTLITKLQSNLAFSIQRSAKYLCRSNGGLQPSAKLRLSLTWLQHPLNISHEHSKDENYLLIRLALRIAKMLI